VSTAASRTGEALGTLLAMRSRAYPSPVTPQCEQPVALVQKSNGYPTDRAIENRRLKAIRKGQDPELCSKGSSYVVGGRHYCATHAGMVALATLVEAGRAGVIAVDAEDGEQEKHA
jgi:hypothetical protein